MNKKLESILKKLESEKNQQKIKKFNAALSILAIFLLQGCIVNLILHP